MDDPQSGQGFHNTKYICALVLMLRINICLRGPLSSSAAEARNKISQNLSRLF